MDKREAVGDGSLLASRGVEGAPDKKALAKLVNELIEANEMLTRQVIELKRVEHEQDLLLAELEHRSKNIMATVYAIARQTLTSPADRPGGLADFQQRLLALDRSHRLLSDARWRAVGLRALLEAILAPYIRITDVGDKAVWLDGPEVELPPSAAMTLGLVFHEMATNAAKHGAASVTDGHIAVTWSCSPCEEGEHVSLLWEERGGPGISPAAKPNFGTKFIKASVRSQFSGSVDQHVEGGRVRWAFSLVLPARDLRQQTELFEPR